MSKGGDESIASGPALSSLRPANVLEIQAREYLKEKEVRICSPF